MRSIALAIGLLWTVGWTQLTPYRLDVEDKIRVTVLRHEQFSGEFQIPADGKVVFPGAGELMAKGLTIAELTEQLREALSKRLRNPDVYVSILEGRPLPVFVNGEVNTPGNYKFQPGWRISEAIAQAGGLKIPAARAETLLIRKNQAPQKVDLVAILLRGENSANLALEPGDNVSVQLKETIRVYVTGQVNAPKDYDLDVGSGIVEAITTAGGYTNDAALTRTVIYRSGDTIPTDAYRALIEGQPGANMTLQNNDVLVIPMNRARIAVLGHVKSPGSFLIPDGRPFRITDALGLAGGPERRAKLSDVRVMRLRNDTLETEKVRLDLALQGHLEHNMPVRDGDVIVIRETNAIDFGTVMATLQGVGIVWASGLFNAFR